MTEKENSIEFYRSILDAMSELVFVKGERSQLLWANKAFRELYGMSEDDLQNIVDSPNSDPDDTLLYVKDDQTVFDTKAALDIPSETVTDHMGKVRFFHTIKTPILSEGDVVRTVGVSRTNEDEYLPSQKSHHGDSKAFASPLRMLLASFPSAVILLDQKNRIVCSSRLWDQYFGCIGDSPNFFFDQAFEELNGLNVSIEKGLRTHSPVSQSLEIDRDREKKFYEFDLNPWKFPDGTIGGICIIASDVTEGHENQQRIFDLNERLTLAMEAANVGVWEWSIEDDRLIWDDQMKNIYGLNVEDARDLSLSDWMIRIRSEDLQFFKGEFNDAILRRGRLNCKFRIQTSTGLEKHIQALGKIITSENGEATRMVGVNHDITETVRQAVEKSQFIANMNHEIRTPLNSIIGLTEVAVSEEIHREETIDLMNRVHKAANHLLSLVDNVLDISKLGADQVKLDTSPVRIKSICNEIVQMLKPLIEEKPLDLNLVFSSEIPEFISSDPIRMKQILLNLLSNAIKFTREGHVSLVVSINKDRLKFVVEDSGIGIPADKKETIFEAFKQVDQTTTRKYGGTGLGLHISRKLAALMGGDIYLDDSYSNGARFVYELPVQLLSAEFAMATSKVVNSSIDTDNASILLVDDSADNIFLVQQMLKKAKANLRVAENGTEAVELAKNEKFDLILMDIHMPRMDGYEATRSIRSLGLNQSTPIVALSACTTKGEIDRIIECGANTYLTKPFTRSSLFAKVEQQLSGGF